MKGPEESHPYLLHYEGLTQTGRLGSLRITRSFLRDINKIWEPLKKEGIGTRVSEGGDTHFDENQTRSKKESL